MKELIATAIGVVLTVTACSPAAKYEAELNEIDSSLTVLDTVESMLNDIAFDSLQMMVTHVENNEDSIRKYYFPDTVSMAVGQHMNACKGIRKTLKGTETKKLNFTNELNAVRKQFETLKTDVENGVHSDEKVKEYLTNEKKALDKLNISVTEFYELQKGKKIDYYQSAPFIDSLIVVWKNKNAEEI